MGPITSRRRPAAQVLWAGVRWCVGPIVLSLLIAKGVLLTWVPLLYNFYVWWLTGLIFLACLRSMHLSGDPTILWKGIIAPVGFSGFLVLIATYCSYQFAQVPTEWLFDSCVFAAAAFLLFTISWILLFPFDRGLTRISSRFFFYWKIACGVLGFALAAMFVRYSLELLGFAHRLRGTALGIFIVQSRLVQGSILVFFLYALRVWIPKGFIEFGKAANKLQTERLDGERSAVLH
jgi:hypothetical protein